MGGDSSSSCSVCLLCWRKSTNTDAIRYSQAQRALRLGSMGGGGGGNGGGSSSGDERSRGWRLPLVRFRSQEARAQVCVHEIFFFAFFPLSRMAPSARKRRAHRCVYTSFFFTSPPPPLSRVAPSACPFPLARGARTGVYMRCLFFPTAPWPAAALHVSIMYIYRYMYIYICMR
jgi:hypothetical protein